MSQRPLTALLVVLVATAALTTAGCQDKLTRPRYETIYIGQPSEQVARTLGEPEARTDGTWTYIRRKPAAWVIIKFENDRVVDKAWHYDEPDR